MTIAPGRRPPEDAGIVPRWFARLLVVVLALVVGYGGAGLVLAIAGRCTPVPVGLLGTPVVGALVRLGWSLDPRPARAGRSAWSVAALVLALGSVLVNAPNAGEHVIVNRDPGVYLVAGRWIADHGTLVVDAGVGPFGTADDVVLESSGTYDEGDGRLDLQFNHLVPVLLAEAHWLGDDGLLVVVPVLLGAAALLTTYAVAARLTGRAWAGFVVAVTLATCLPMLAAVRDTYSEAATWLLLSGGLWAWTRATDEVRVPMAAFGGLVLGTVAMTRIDAIVYLLPVPLVVGLLVAGLTIHGRRQDRRTVTAFAIGIVPGVLIGASDLLLRSREYYRDLDAEVTALWGALAISAVGGWAVRSRVARRVAGRADGLRSWAARRRRILAAGGAAAVVVVGILAWFVRPHVQEARSSEAFEYIGAIQAAEDQPVEPDRRYDERTMQWMAWYVGPPAVALAVAGGALVAHRSIDRRSTPTHLAWLVLAGGTALYLWRPSITPDQIWASRRFVPAALPLIVTLAAVAAVAAVGAVRRRSPDRPVLAAAAGVALSAVIVAPALARTAPVAALSDQHGYFDLVDDLCAEVGGDAVLAVDGERAGVGLPQTMRSFCDVPVGLLADDDTDPERVAALADAWAAEGRALHVVGATPDVVGALVPGVALTQLGPYRTDQALEATVTRPPGRLVEVSDELYVATVPVPG